MLGIIMGSVVLLSNNYEDQKTKIISIRYKDKNVNKFLLQNKSKIVQLATTQPYKKKPSWRIIKFDLNTYTIIIMKPLF